MKKIVSLLLAGVLLCLCGCSAGSVQGTGKQEALLRAEQLPCDCTSFDGSVIRIESVDYTTDWLPSSRIRVTVSGTKIRGIGNYGSYDMIRYKFYDSEGYVVDSGTLSLKGLSEGDKFRDDSIRFFKVTPGETYTIVFSGYI